MVNLTLYEQLLDEASKENIIVKEVPLRSNADGLYIDNKIALNKSTLSSSSEKACVLAEELGHHYKTYGHIIDLKNIDNIKQEKKARQFAYDKIVGISGIIESFKNSCRSIDEIADYLSVTPEFLNDAINYYKDKYGTKIITLGEYSISFVPNFIIYKQF